MTELRASTGLPDDRRRSGLEIAGLRIALIATAIIALIRLHHIALSGWHLVESSAAICWR
jgi:hypothetical protein